MNPYNFVPLGAPAVRREVNTHERFGAANCAGKLTCTITILSEFFIAEPHERSEKHQHQEFQFLRESGKPIIPGSSLKGVIRSVAEALSGSCLALAGDRKSRYRNPNMLSFWDKNRPHEYPVPDGFAPCGMFSQGDRDQKVRRDADRKLEACPACRMFGFLVNKKVLLGHVNFSDALLLSKPEFKPIILYPSGAPGPRHRTFYGTTSTGFRDARGRKFYYHRPQGARTMDQKQEQNKTVEALLPPALFEFKVAYENLAADELALLIFALTLEEPMRHKLGMGKGLGLGSVQIAVKEWRTRNLNERYRSFGGGTAILTGKELDAALAQQRAAYHQAFPDQAAPLAELRRILAWDAKQTPIVEYPTFMWFKDYSAVPLEQVPDDAGQYKLQQTRESRPIKSDTPFKPSAEQQRAEEAALKKAAEIMRRLKDKTYKPVKQNAYTNNATEHKAEVQLPAAEGSWEVILPELPLQRIKLVPKSVYSRVAVGAKLRVRVKVDGNGNVLRAEEL